ncbi:pre-SET motif domain-containing protein [Ditylenchus destructor]|nr:pre-SET motif domain-containing protein [Ditylenchus destructor]
MDPTTFAPRLAYSLVSNPNRVDFVRKYLRLFPDWPLVRLKKSENTMRVCARREGKEESAFVLDVDRQMCLLRFPNQKVGPAGKIGRECVLINCKEHEHTDEWIYRGDCDRFPTLQSNTGPVDPNSQSSVRNARLHRNRSSHFEMAFPDYDRSSAMVGVGNADEPISVAKAAVAALVAQSSNSKVQTARKSTRRKDELADTAISTTDTRKDPDIETRKKNSNKIKQTTLHAPEWKNLVYQQHKVCSPTCLDVMKDSKAHLDPQYSPCSPYFTPLMYGYKRMVYNIRRKKGDVKKSQAIIYRAPCGIRLCSIEEVAEYLQVTATKHLTIDLFTFHPDIREYILVKPFKPETLLCDDFAEGKEDVKIPVVNAVGDEPLPAMQYRERRFADSREIYDNIQPQFCSGCTCTDNCSDPNRCECQQLTIKSHERLSASLRVTGSPVYKNKTLMDKLISGVYECNELCPCNRNLCFNRVVQQKIKIPLQLYMTAETGWGVRTLVDLAPGTFVSTYSGSLLTDQMAEQQGNSVSDTYFAELDLYEMVQREKQQQGVDLIEEDEGFASDTDNNTVTLSSNSKSRSRTPANEPLTPGIEEGDVPSSIDEEMEAALLPSTSQGPPKNGSRSPKPDNGSPMPFDFEEYFGDNCLFIVDAQEKGNIGRFLNHSCEPNCFVQMVLVDTHDYHGWRSLRSRLYQLERSYAGTTAILQTLCQEKCSYVNAEAAFVKDDCSEIYVSRISIWENFISHSRRYLLFIIGFNYLIELLFT